MTDRFLHFCPDDGYFGDPMPVYDNGVYHFYYTKLYRPETGKPMSWGHISTTDFITYTEHPDPFEAGAVGTPFNTGCVFVLDGVFHAYYAGYDGDGVPCFLHSVSADGISFPPSDEVCFSRPDGADSPYRQDNTWRDPYVFYDSDAGLYRMVFCAKPPAADDHPDCYAGVVGMAVSEDLVGWTCLDPMSLRGIAMTLECPEIFRYEDRWVLIYYWHETRFRTAASVYGPWERGDVISPDHFDFMAARHMYDGQRHFLVGWLPRRDCDCKERTWGGNMCVIRELSFADGRTPETRFIGELDTVFSNAEPTLLPEKATVCGKGWTVTETGFRADMPVGGTMLSYHDLPHTCLCDMRVTMENGHGLVVLFVGVHCLYTTQMEYLDEGYAVMLDASENMIRLRRHYMWDQRNDIAVIPHVFTPGVATHIRILRNMGILEVEADGKQSLVSRLLSDAPGGFAVSVQDTVAEITDFHVYTKEREAQ